VAWAGLGWAGLDGLPGLGWPGLAWAGLGWPGLAWADLAWPGLAWAGLAWADLAWPGLAWPELSWAGGARSPATSRARDKVLAIKSRPKPESNWPDNTIWANCRRVHSASPDCSGRTPSARKTSLSGSDTRQTQ
jgi:hypothetical protein